MQKVREIHDVPILTNRTIGANSKQGVTFSLIVTDLLTRQGNAMIGLGSN